MASDSKVIMRAMLAIERLWMLGKRVPEWPGGRCPVCSQKDGACGREEKPEMAAEAEG